MKTFCISHVKDVDGLGSAALVVAATRGEFLLSDYVDLLDNLKRVPKDATEFVLCDLGADNSNLSRFVEEIRQISSHASVTYIDHHYMSPATKKRLKAAGVKLVHDTGECSSMLAYLTFKDSLPEGARLIALCGAVTDYADGSPHGRVLMEQSDRQFVLLEASMLAYALGQKGGTEGFPELVVRELSKMRHPHEIDGVPRLAVEQLEAVSRLAEVVKREGKRMGKLAYMVTTQHSTGNIAKLLIGAFEVPVGVAMKEKDRGRYEVSIRCTSKCKAHLGRTIAVIANKLQGNGGGHRKAAGCSIPISRANDMLEALAKKI